MTARVPKNDLIGIVGPCSAGKSTLIGKLNELNYSCRHIAQDHSYVPDMWQRLVNPIALIYLDVSYGVSMQRRPLNLNLAEFDEQKNRLHHAFKNADLYLHTDDLSPEDVANKVVAFLNDHNIHPPGMQK